MSAVVYVPSDAAALSLGAERSRSAIAREARRAGSIVIVKRNGSRGMCWLEPLVEVVNDGERYAYGPVSAKDVASSVRGRFSAQRRRIRCNSVPREDIPYFSSQQRLTFARVGVIDPTSLEDYLAHGGYQGLRNALDMSPPRSSKP